MNYTPEQLREWAAGKGKFCLLDIQVQLHAHASALEENARANYATRRAVERAERAESELAKLRHYWFTDADPNETEYAQEFAEHTRLCWNTTHQRADFTEEK